MSLRTNIPEREILKDFQEVLIRRVTYFVNKEDPSISYMSSGQDPRTGDYLLEQIQESTLLATLARSIYD